MIDARSVRVIVRGNGLRRQVGRRRDASHAVERADQEHRRERWRVGRPGVRHRGRVGRARLAPEEADAAQRSLGQARARVAVGAVQEQAGTQLGLGVGRLVGQRPSGPPAPGAAASRGS